MTTIETGTEMLRERRVGGVRALTLVQSWALAATSAIVFGSVVLIAAVHIADRYFVNHVSGSWMTLARFVHDGTLYPPLHEAGRTFGTFYMPLPFLAHGLVSFLTGEYLVSGKMTAYATALVLFGLMFALLRSLGCSRLVSASLVAAVVATPAGYLAVMSIRGDALSVAFQLGALLLVWRTQSRRAVLGAAALCALALVSKTTGVWAAAAIAIWLVLRDRRLAARFAVAYVALTAVLLGVLELASGGRLTENLGALAFSQPKVPGATPLSGGSTLVHLAFLDRDAPWLLFGCALAAGVVFLRRREISLFQLALAISLLELLVILRDAGADYNHLLDMAVLTALVVGELWGRLRPERETDALVGAVLAAAVVLTAASAYVQTMKPDVGLAARLAVGHGSDAPYSTHPLRGVVAPNARILSEDPSLPILSGQLPVTDPLILPRLAKAHPAWVAELVRRVQRRQFDDVVLIRPLDPNGYHATEAFGTAVTAAIADNYRFKVGVPTGSLTYYVYVPR